MGKPQRTSRRGLWALVAGLALLGCLSPTLPLPPPSRPDVSAPDATGYVTVTGRVQARSSVFIENLRTQRIAGQSTDDGEYEVELVGASGDRLAVWYMVGTEESPSIEVLVPEANSGGAGGAGGAN